MTALDILTLTERLRYWKDMLKEQHSMKKILRDDLTIARCLQRINVIGGWLSGSQDTEPDVKVAPMTREEFNDATASLGDTTKPGAVIIVSSKSEIDDLWPKVYRSNIQLAAPTQELADYIRFKARQTKPYQHLRK